MENKRENQGSKLHKFRVVFNRLKKMISDEEKDNMEFAYQYIPPCLFICQLSQSVVNLKLLLNLNHTNEAIPWAIQMPLHPMVLSHSHSHLLLPTNLDLTAMIPHLLLSYRSSCKWQAITPIRLQSRLRPAFVTARLAAPRLVRVGFYDGFAVGGGAGGCARVDTVLAELEDGYVLGAHLSGLVVCLWSRWC